MTRYWSPLGYSPKADQFKVLRILRYTAKPHYGAGIWSYNLEDEIFLLVSLSDEMNRQQIMEMSILDSCLCSKTTMSEFVGTCERLDYEGIRRKRFLGEAILFVDRFIVCNASSNNRQREIDVFKSNGHNLWVYIMLNSKDLRCYNFFRNLFFMVWHAILHFRS